MIRRAVMPIIGVARTCIHAVAYNDQEKSESFRQPICGARSLWMVVIKFSPVRMDENPRIKTAETAVFTLVVVNSLNGT